MPNSDGAGQDFHGFGTCKVITYQAHTARLVKACVRVMGDDPPRLLAPVLQRVQAEGYETCGVCDADNTKHPTFFAEFVIIEGMGGGHGGRQKGSSESVGIVEALLAKQLQPVTTRSAYMTFL